MYKVSIVVLVIMTGIALSGCQHAKKQLGAIVGGTLGGIVANKTADGKNKKLWTVGGVVAGAWIGSKIGQYLDEKDQQAMAVSTQKAIVTGEKQTWSNPETNRSGSAEIVSENQETVEMAVPVLKDRVKTVPPMDMIGASYQVNKTSNVRSGPGTDYKVLETMSSGTTVDVIGKVQDRPWMMVGFNNTGRGFMHSSRLQQLSVAQQKIKNKTTETPAAEIVEKKITSRRTCRTVKQIITLENGSEKVEEITACQGPNGWKTI